jgi:transcriptional regulator with XRE-family HTH domain
VIPFGEYLRECREKTGMRMVTLAGLLGVSVTYLSELERGRRGVLAPERWDTVCANIGADRQELARFWLEHAISRVELPYKEHTTFRANVIDAARALKP